MATPTPGAVGKTVVITGSTRGIGRGLASEFLSRGCRVVVSGRSEKTVADAVAQLGAEHDPERVTGCQCDVAHEDEVTKLWEHAVGRFGRVDHWINNAGVGHDRMPFWELAEDQIEAVFATNVVGTFNGSRIALRGMQNQGFGWLWNMEGLGSNGQTVPGMSVYGTSKRALRYFSRALVKETKGTGANVGLLSPGIVITDFITRQKSQTDEDRERARRIYNILGDRVETVTPFLVDGVLGASKSGVRIAWLTRRKAAGRFATARFSKRDVFTEV